MIPVLGLFIAYLSGSFPSAYLAGRIVKGVDLRTVGSGNLGATNVYRNLGFGAAITVFVLDVAKGALPVWLLPTLFDAGAPRSNSLLWWALAYGIAAILGHAKPIFLLGKGGGKGVATATGMFLVLAPLPILATLIVCIAVVWFSGYMSLGSISAAVLFPLLVWFNRGLSPVLLGALLVALFICWTHRANIVRLRNGTEARLFPRKERNP
ncbi:MAG TPA: glycerol-3-phosphate 1-O-acyltransferase PlsY [Gemmatimonadaceae bacterium]|jgi:glycerol-3-phosphate acyltransferase PlsY